jgi:predicted DNA-binding transcriptional regulator YafY
MNRTDRLLAIVLALQAKGWQRAEDLASTFEISKRTIYRDMEALAESGVPVMSSPGQGYALVEGYFLPPLSFTSDEATILLLGADFMAKSFDDQYRAAASSAGSKIQAVLPNKLRYTVRELQTRMVFVAMNPLENTARPELLLQIRRAAIQSKTVRMEYHSRSSDEIAGTKSTRDADPYGLVHLDKGWYMVAYCHLRCDIRHFRLDRIDQLQVLEQTFDRPADFQLRDPSTQDRSLVVRALFAREVARWVQEERSFFMVGQEQHDDGLLVTFRVRQLSDITQWLLSWGRHVCVLEPDSLRKQLIDEARATLEVYKQAESLLP